MQKQLTTFAVGLLVLLATAMRVDAHAFLVRAEPRVGSRVKKAPNEVRIWFSEPVQPTLSAIKVFDASGKQLDKKDTHLDHHNRALLRVSLTPIPPGSYKVSWRVVSVDTHVTTGDFRFQVAP
jgi:methionine-rich copper-binding protein CopC